ncbi:MAG: 4-hydroxy-tetrahydrodipicolinate synthase [Firmicutes bacterium]|nr:4-hydroxy-tetrahydrodipicolinate synthase [Bacillota bacterium]
MFNGVCTALVTPFRKNKVDLAALTKLLDFQIDNRVDALCVLGTTGEATTLSFDEKIMIAKFCLARVGGHIPIIFGIGGNNPTEITKLGLALKDIASTDKEFQISVMLTPPYYNKCTQAAAVKYFHQIADDIGLPMIVYNVPGRAGMNLEPATLKKIATHPLVVGIKEASGSMSQIIDVVNSCPDISVYCGDDALSLPCYAVGCRGVISVASNIRPVETREIWRTHDAELFMSELPIYRALFCEVNPGPIKYALSLKKLCSPEVRPPLTILSKQSILQHGFRKFFVPTSG